jgi:hypothetical protein
MQLKETLFKINQSFVYTADPKSWFTDYWFAMPEKNGEMRGDCDDYSITALWLICGGFWSFLWNVIILHRYRLHRVKTLTGEYHIVAEVNRLWFDNWAKGPYERKEFFAKTGHTFLMTYISPTIILFMISGWILKKTRRNI